MPLTIPIAHDFSCPWCWVGLKQSQKLRNEFDVEFEWLPYELWPRHLERPVSTPGIEMPNRPKTPTRFELMLAAEGMGPLRRDRPSGLDTHATHEAVEFAKGEGVQDQLVERLYRALYEDALDITNPEIINDLASGIVQDRTGMIEAVKSERFADRITHFDAPAYRSGVFNVPTFFVAGERYAEQPYSVLQTAVEAALLAPSNRIYWRLEFPPAPTDRPYTFVDMIETIDGKILSGKANESVQDLGSNEDKLLMKRLEKAADAVLMGANTLRATPKSWSPQTPKRFVLSKSGNVPQDHAYLSGDSAVLDQLDLRPLRAQGIKRLLVLGGSEVNAQMLAEDLIDEIFVTIAPKVKLGRDTLTIAGGEPLARDALKKFELIEDHRIGDELFLRYRRKLD
jgi:predicted DsbA family dithiol-disulfide isomerase/riboflavin biosynthesis pyrimidine reductase